MIELARFQQLRPAQKVSDEQKPSIGLQLYPGGSLSAFATALVGVKNQDDCLTAINDYKSKRADVLTDPKQVMKPIRALYLWLDFKARPIRVKDLKDFVKTMPPLSDQDLKNEWTRIADNFLLAAATRILATNFCVDFQLLIRGCNLIDMFLKADAAGNHAVVDAITDAHLEELLARPILLPPGVLISRCKRDCSQHKQMSAPLVELRAAAADDPCSCKCDDTCQPPSKHCICVRTYVADLYLIKEELARFEAGDIADIENILAGEKKVRKHWTLRRSEDTTQRETETITSEERDHEVNEKASLQTEVKNTLDEKLNVDAGVTATFKYGESISLTPHANVVYNSSKSESQNVARSYSKDVIDRAISKMQEKVSKLVVSKIISEVREKNTHEIDNAQMGADHRAGIYYWVNKVSHAQVYNYGKHMMFDAIVPEPGAMFKELYKRKMASNKRAALPVKPTIPVPGGTAPLTPLGITRANYGILLNQSGIGVTDEIQPPDHEKAVELAFSQNVPEPADEKTAAFSASDAKVDVPTGYRAVLARFDVRCNTEHPVSTPGKDGVAVSVNLGNSCLLHHHFNEWGVPDSQLPLPNKNWANTNQVNMNNEQGTLTLAVAGFASVALSLSGSVSITCEISGETFEKWQGTIYNLIMTDYNRKLDAYNSAQGGDIPLVQIKGRNPFLNREIERNEFKRAIVGMLMCNYFNGIGSEMERVMPCGYPEPNWDQLDKDAPVIQFFEQVFEWEYVTYMFYHSMWARKCKWADLITEDSGDPLFDKFLMSGAARVQVPIRLGMEAVFNWFLETGQIWGASGTPPLPGDDDYVSMIQELKEAEQGNYRDRPGLIEMTTGSDVLVLTDSTYYWDVLNNAPNELNIANDIDREILVDFKVYRIVKVEQATAGSNAKWNITIDKVYTGANQNNLKHAVGALFVGAPWEVVIPTELVYLRNKTDKLPVYPLT